MIIKIRFLIYLFIYFCFISCDNTDIHPIINITDDGEYNFVEINLKHKDKFHNVYEGSEYDIIKINNNYLYEVEKGQIYTITKLKHRGTSTDFIYTEFYYINKKSNYAYCKIYTGYDLMVGVGTGVFLRSTIRSITKINELINIVINLTISSNSKPLFNNDYILKLDLFNRSQMTEEEKKFKDHVDKLINKKWK